MRRIAVIADTHDRLPVYVVDAIAGADEIWHLGDVCEPMTLDPLLGLGCPLVIVQGNCDFTGEWQLSRRLERNGKSFHLEHIPPKRAPRGVDVVLHGHTHVPRDEMVHGVRFLNPGCITRPNRGAPASFAWLAIDAQGGLDWQIIRLAEIA